MHHDDVMRQQDAQQRYVNAREDAHVVDVDVDVDTPACGREVEVEVVEVEVDVTEVQSSSDDASTLCAACLVVLHYQ